MSMTPEEIESCLWKHQDRLLKLEGDSRGDLLAQIDSLSRRLEVLENERADPDAIITARQNGLADGLERSYRAIGTLLDKYVPMSKPRIT